MLFAMQFLFHGYVLSVILSVIVAFEFAFPVHMLFSYIFSFFCSDDIGGPACCRGGNAVNSRCFTFDNSTRGVNIHPYVFPLLPTHHSTESGAQRCRSEACHAAVFFLACSAFSLLSKELFKKKHTPRKKSHGVQCGLAGPL